METNCLPEIHKPDKSVRPIVSDIYSPPYLISQWLAEEYKNLAVKKDTPSIKKTLEFVNAIHNLPLEDGEILVSFDVWSLFHTAYLFQRP